MATQLKKKQRTPGVRGTISQLQNKQCATVKLDGYGYGNTTARLHISVFKRILNCGIDDLTIFMKRGDKVVMVTEPNSGRGNSKWSVFDVRRSVNVPRPSGYLNCGCYMDMTGDQLKVPSKYSALEAAKLLASIRRVLSVWNDIDLVTFVEMWRFQKNIQTSEDANSLRGFVDACLTGIYCEFSGGSMKLYQSFEEEEIRQEMKRRFLAIVQEEPRQREVKESVDKACVVESEDDVGTILGPLLEAAAKGDKVVVGIDCEGASLGRYGSLTLLQVATMDGNAYLFDILKNPGFLKAGHLKQLLEDQGIVKVLHDCRNDSSALKHLFGVKLAGVFDTSVAYSTIMEQCNKVGGTYRIGYKALCEVLGENTLFKDDAMADKMHNTNFWEERPLTDEMKKYAAADTVTLVPHVYKSLDRMISPFWRVYFEANCVTALSEL